MELTGPLEKINEGAEINQCSFFRVLPQDPSSARHETLNPVTEQCPASKNYTESHGVNFAERTNEHGTTYDERFDLYQQGQCMFCRDIVFSRRDSLADTFHEWRLKEYVIVEELTLEDVLS